MKKLFMLLILPIWLLSCTKNIDSLMQFYSNNPTYDDIKKLFLDKKTPNNAVFWCLMENKKNPDDNTVREKLAYAMFIYGTTAPKFAKLKWHNDSRNRYWDISQDISFEKDLSKEGKAITKGLYDHGTSLDYKYFAYDRYLTSYLMLIHSSRILKELNKEVLPKDKLDEFLKSIKDEALKFYNTELKKLDKIHREYVFNKNPKTARDLIGTYGDASYNGGGYYYGDGQIINIASLQRRKAILYYLSGDYESFLSELPQYKKNLNIIMGSRNPDNQLDDYIIHDMYAEVHFLKKDYDTAIEYCKKAGDRCTLDLQNLRTLRYKQKNNLKD
ncbi:hypothetical protein U5B43_07400 [Campylobacter sp. 9BO]|uniref:hypothetical protein n=1 Tax=Campylobacter sp. 9BO TaxID=3424759 RepID=UPI003D325F7E